MIKIQNTDGDIIEYTEAIAAISLLKEELFSSEELSHFFGQERNNSLRSILGKYRADFWW